MAGEPPEVEAFCRDHPDCGSSLRERLLEIRYVTADAGQPSDPDLQHPERIGPYRVLEVLGEGGMGTVYLAYQSEPVQRQVALKVIKLGMDSKHRC